MKSRSHAASKTWNMMFITKLIKFGHSVTSHYQNKVKSSRHGHSTINCRSYATSPTCILMLMKRHIIRARLVTLALLISKTESKSNLRNRFIQPWNVDLMLRNQPAFWCLSPDASSVQVWSLLHVKTGPLNHESRSHAIHLYMQPTFSLSSPDPSSV